MSALGRLRLGPQVHIFQTLGIVCLDTSHSHGQEQSDQPCQSEDILEMPLSLKYDPNVPYNLACPACPRHWSLQRWSASPPRCAVRGECMATEELFPPRNEAAECEDLAWLEGHGMAMLTSTVKDECFLPNRKPKVYSDIQSHSFFIGESRANDFKWSWKIHWCKRTWTFLHQEIKTFRQKASKSSSLEAQQTFPNLEEGSQLMSLSAVEVSSVQNLAACSPEKGRPIPNSKMQLHRVRCAEKRKGSRDHLHTSCELQPPSWLHSTSQVPGFAQTLGPPSLWEDKWNEVMQGSLLIPEISTWVTQTHYNSII